ncbi:hypothetical protein AB0L47_27285, partial [Streptomyces bobili]
MGEVGQDRLARGLAQRRGHLPHQQAESAGVAGAEQAGAQQPGPGGTSPHERPRPTQADAGREAFDGSGGRCEREARPQQDRSRGEHQRDPGRGERSFAVERVDTGERIHRDTAGVAALIASANPGITPAQIRAKLAAQANDIACSSDSRCT